jgi:acetyl-CoA synthetase
MLNATDHDQVVPVPRSWLMSAHIDNARYHEMFRRSMNDPEGFWGDVAKRIDWYQPWTKVKNTSFHKPVSIRWYENAKLNVSYNCVDRHLPRRANQTAIIFEPDNPQGVARHITYQMLFDEVNRVGNTLRSMGIKKGDRVTIYMPMIPEAAYAMLACARIGAIHSVVFGGFSPDSIADRVQDCESSWVITADEGARGGRTLAIKANVDKALMKCPGVKGVLVFKNTGASVPMMTGRDHWYHEISAKLDGFCEPEVMDSEDPLFILYTSGSTNKPKGVLHTTGGYLVYVSFTHEVVFDYREGDIYWCTADVGWVTGHSYIIYGPLANGATTLMFEGIPTYPDASRLWEVVDKHKVNIFYTAPTAIRALMREGERPVTKCSRKSLRLLGSVGEPINPEAWLWYHRVVGEHRCPIVDTWWQTETGGILISPLPGATALKPGSATMPMFGIRPILVDDKGAELHGPAVGNLCIADSWPGIMRTVYKDHERFEQTYFSAYPGYYFTGDGCRRDEDGYFWITGRVDDVINVAGHRLGTAEIESALVAHTKVAEAAVVGFPHDLKGQGIYAFVTLKLGEEPTDSLKKELIQWVRNEISPIATPDHIQWAPGLPKTRSGKIMRRILRKIAEDSPENLGDISTLADPSVVDDLVKNRLKQISGT